MSNPHGVASTGETSSAQTQSSISASSSRNGTTRRAVRLFAPDEESSSDEEILSGAADADGVPPTQPRASSYPGPPQHTSPQSRISPAVSSTSSTQPRLARFNTFAPSSSSRAPITPGVSSSHSAAPPTGLTRYDSLRKTFRASDVSHGGHEVFSRRRPSHTSGSDSGLRAQSFLSGRNYPEPESSYFHSLGQNPRHVNEVGSDDENDGGRSPGWAIDVRGAFNATVGTKRDGEGDGAVSVRSDVSAEEKQERLDWQGMLESVLTSDVLKLEEARISQAMPTESFREEFGQALWWQIRARLRGRTEAEEKTRVQERRARVVDSVLEEVAKFQVQVSTPKMDGSGTALFNQTEESQPQVSSLDQVDLILAKLHAIKALYPNLAAMRQDKPLYASPEFRTRVDALLAWSTVVSSLQRQLRILQKWTGSDDLDITKPNTTKEKALVGKYRYHPLDPKAANAPGGDAADDSSFLDRVMKEDNLQSTFERRAVLDSHRLVYNAKDTVVNYLPHFQDAHLPDFQYELVKLVSFPSRLIIEALKVRLDAASRLVDPNPMVVADFLENLRLSIEIAVVMRQQYNDIVKPDPDGRWKIPPCLAPEYNDVLLDGLRVFFKLIHWKLRGVGKASYFRETEVLEEESQFLYEMAESIDGGDLVVAENFCVLTNKLLIRAANHLDQQVRMPSTANKQNGRDQSVKADEMVQLYSKMLDSARMRHRKTQRFCRKLTQRFNNSAEYSIEDIDMEDLVQTLHESGHFLVYTNSFESKGTYIVADGSLWGQPDDVRHLLQRAFSKSIPGARARFRRRTSAASMEQTEPTVMIDADGVEVYVDGEEGEVDAGDLAAYVLLLSPRQNFVWSGAVMTLEVNYIEYSLQDNRIRLIADGPAGRLKLCKHLFAEALIDPESGTTLDLPCVVEQQAHLPTIQAQLLKIGKSSYRLSECIVQSAPLVRTALRGEPGSQELVENWYSFATEHGTRVSWQMSTPLWDRFSRLLMRLAISWISFICQECDPTDRKTFRWTVTALTYAFTMTRGNNIFALDRSEFGLLRRHVGVCVSLLISHFDILGARSSLEAKKEADRIDQMRRLQRLQENLDDEFLPRTPSVAGEPHIDRSIRLTVEERLRLIAELEQKRVDLAPAQVGTVLDEEVSEDRALVFLAASKSNISMRWQQGAYIGGGASGSVYLGYSLQDNTVFAVKILPTVDLQSSPALYESIKRESDVMSLLSHPNIVGFLGLEVHRNRVCLFQEYCEGGSLGNMMEYGKIDDEEVVGAFTIQLLRGLEYLHSNMIEHRDLKPENILIGANSVLKLADFGTAKIIKGNKTLARTRGGAHAKMEGLEGTPMYMAPEMIKNQRTGKLGACDIWGLGCIVLEMTTGKKPWSFLDFDNEWAIMFHLGATTEHPPLPEPHEMSEQGIEFIEACISLDPQERPTAQQLLGDEWLAPMIAQMAEQEEGSYEPTMENVPPTEDAPPSAIEEVEGEGDEDPYATPFTSHGADQQLGNDAHEHPENGGSELEQ